MAATDAFEGLTRSMERLEWDCATASRSQGRRSTFRPESSVAAGGGGAGEHGTSFAANPPPSPRGYDSAGGAGRGRGRSGLSASCALRARPDTERAARLAPADPPPSPPSAPKPLRANLDRRHTSSSGTPRPSGRPATVGRFGPLGARVLSGASSLLARGATETTMALDGAQADWLDLFLSNCSCCCGRVLDIWASVATVSRN